MDRFSIVWCRNNLLIVFLLCSCFITFGYSEVFYEADCPVATEENDNEAKCSCEKKYVTCHIGSSLPISSTFWSNFGHLKSPVNAVHLLLFQVDSSNLTYFPINLFPNLSPSIDDVTLSSWKFSSIPLFKVPRTSKIKILTIQDNELFTTLGSRVFSPLSVFLERLILTSNGLDNIDPLAFKGLKNLGEVKLFSNKLTSLPDNLFIDSIKLNNMSLHTNNITLLRQATFRGLSALRDLDLNRNQLFTIVDNTFLELISLKSLDLSYNKINSLGPLAFKGLTQIEFIDLSSNQLQNLPAALLTHTPKLMTIDLKHNRLSSLDDNFLKQLPKTIYLKDNEWNCNCNLILYEKTILVGNSETKCTTSSDEFNKSSKPVKPLEMTFEQYINHTRDNSKGESCNQINSKEKRSHLTMASTSPLGGQKSSSFALSWSNSMILTMITLSTLINLK